MPELFLQAILANLSLTRPNVAMPLCLAGASALLLLGYGLGRGGRRMQMAAAILVLVDMVGYAANFNPTSDTATYSAKPDVLAAFASETEPFRKATFLPDMPADLRSAKETLAISWGMTFGVEDINGFNSLQTRRYTDYLFGERKGDVAYGLLDDTSLLRPQNHLLDSLNVKYLLVPQKVRLPLPPKFRQTYLNDEVRVYKNTDAFPRAFFADAVRAETDPHKVLAEVTSEGFDGRRLALVETTEAPPIASSAGAAPPSLKWQDRSPNTLTLETSTDAPRFLVLSEMYFPDWRAEIDGIDTQIYRTNYLFRGLVVPEGHHTVRLCYRPGPVFTGALVTAVALLFSAALYAIQPRHRGMASTAQSQAVRSLAIPNR